MIRFILGESEMRRVLFLIFVLLLIAGSASATGQETDFDQKDNCPPPRPDKSHNGDAPEDPPTASDEIFVVDTGPGLDTGCTFHSEGDLVFEIIIDRYIGDVDRLLQTRSPSAPYSPFIGETAHLQMPAWDVDYYYHTTPERDRVYFNGHLVREEYLTGDNRVWKMNEFDLPIEWVNFPESPGDSAVNEVRIVIDTGNSQDVWCTAIDWAALEIDVARPVVFVHGIFSNGGTWEGVWTDRLTAAGLPYDNSLNMGNLDGITENSTKIANQISTLKALWNVDKVNIVAHSKGGLDSRHFVEHNDDVDQLIQIGTPNAGSPLADYAQGLLIIGLRDPVSIIAVNKLAGSGGYQLTRPYMRTYNALHGYNRGVTYTSLAGVWDMDCNWYNLWCHEASIFMKLVVGNGDGVVPRSSVHALNYSEHLELVTYGEDLESLHTNLTKSQQAFYMLLGQVATHDKSFLDKAMPELPDHTPSIVGEIGVGEIHTHTIFVEENAPTIFTATYPEGEVALELTSPSGIVFTPDNVAGQEGLRWSDNEILGGKMAEMYLESPEVGDWQISVMGEVLGIEPVIAYALTSWLPSSTLSFEAETIEEFVPLNSPFGLRAEIQDAATPIQGASVVGTVLRPDSTLEDIVLYDDGAHNDDLAGDGIYGASYDNTSMPGVYKLAISGNGDAGGPGASFSREAFDFVTVSASSSRFLDGFRETPLDDNGNGFFDWLNIGLDVEVSAAGTYRLTGILQDGSGNNHPASIENTLSPGVHSLTLEFDGGALFANRVDGPYSLVDLWLAEVDGPNILPLDNIAKAYTTDAYGFTLFEHGSIWLTGLNDSVPADMNGNGLFDRLTVYVGAHFENLDSYDWSARLEDRFGTEIGFASGSSTFSDGDGTIEMAFPGLPIGSNGVDGPFYVKDLLVYSRTQSMLAGTAMETPAYPANGFVGFSGDESLPVINVISPVEDGTYYAEELILFEYGAEDPESGIGSLSAELDGYLGVQSGSELNVQVLGQHYFDVMATNGQGNQASKRVVFNVLPGARPSGCLWVDATTPPLDNPTDGHGIAWGDFDNDGDDDLFLANAGENALLRNEGGGNFTKMPNLPVNGGDSRSAAWADYDNDGDLDLYLVNWGSANRLYRNDGDGVFADVTTAPLDCELQGNNVAWADFDNDRDMDIYVTNFDGPNRLFRNDGSGFSLVEGTPLSFTGASRGCAWGDYDGDMDPDLYVSVQEGANRLFRNDGGAFQDVTVAPLGDEGSGKGVAWGDYDNDGDLDLYLVNRNTPNRLFNNNAGLFSDVADSVTGDTGDGRTCGWGDYNNDGWLDLFITNFSGENRLFHNMSGKAFVDTTCGDLKTPVPAWGMGWSDYDNDGDLDMYVAHHTWLGLPNHLFRNDLIVNNSWLKVELVGTRSNRFGVGAKVLVDRGTDNSPQMREITAGSGYMSQPSVVAQFGLGQTALVDVTVLWPSGRQQHLPNQPVNQSLVIEEPPIASDSGEISGPLVYGIRCHPNPFNPMTNIEFSLPKAGPVSLQVYDLTGRLVRTLVAEVSYDVGTHTVPWNGTDLTGRVVASGVYFYRLVAEDQRLSGRMVLLK